ncbi:MAG: MFS transporter, partial [Candidatus Sericytochromatia bacterium]
MPAALGLLYLVILAAFLNLFFQFPLTPVLARQLTGDLNLVALAVSAYSLANLVGNLFAGLVVDRFPKAPVLAGGLGLGAIALVGAGAASSIGGLVGGLMLNGLGLALVTPAAFALLSQSLPEAARARGMAASGAAIGLAAMIGPPITGVLSDRLGPGPTLQAAGIFLLVVAVVGYLALRRLPDASEPDVGLGDIQAVIADRRLHLGFAGAFVLMFANGGLVFALPPHVKGLGLSGAMIGLFFSLFALAAIGVFLSPLSKRAYRGDANLVMAAGAATIAV